MISKSSLFIKKFFLGGELHSIRGIKSLRYRILFILEPVYFVLIIIISAMTHLNLLRNQSYNVLVIITVIQFSLFILYIYFYRLNRLNRSFSIFIFLLFTLFAFLQIQEIFIYGWMFFSVLIASLLYRVKRTIIVFLLLSTNLLFNEIDFFHQLINNPIDSSNWNSIVFFTIFSSFLTGSIISIIVYFLERSFSKLYRLQISLDNKNLKLNDELMAKEQIKDELIGHELKFKTIVEYGFDGITIVDKNGNNKFISNSTEKITGYSAESYREGALDFDKVHSDDRQRVIENFRNISENRSQNSIIDYRYMHKDGNWRNLEVSITNLLDNPGIEGILFVYRDVTKNIIAEKKARYFEYYDQLTDLPNQLMFSEKITQEIERSSVRNRAFAVMCLGINRFKNINGEYGTAIGDLVLKQIGSRLKSNFRGDDLVSRMMGDKFLILFSDMKSENDAIAIVQKTMNSFETAFWINNRDIAVSVSIGISIYPQDGEKKDELIKNSETALFLCKEKREQKYFLYNKNLNDDLINRIQIEKEIYRAIENQAFTIYYHPKINKEGNVHGAEALIRWFSPERGMVPPSVFIPISERNRSIISIGKIVIEKTFYDMREWYEKGITMVKISINVASLQFSDPDFINTVIELQEKYNISPEYVEFEITETGIMENEKQTVRIMNILTQLGYSISIDDFGTGYSSLNKLKDYPLHSLKIDKSFIDPIPANESSCNIVKTIIDLAHSLDYLVVAEGVEDKTQVDFLNDYNCDLIQGYYYHKPMPQNQFIKLLG